MIKALHGGGLYDVFDRVSCWCCPLQKLGELKRLYQNYPELWQKLKAWEKMTDMTFKENYTIERLEARFDLEDKREKAGLTINPHSKEFRIALKDCLEGLPILNDRLRKDFI